VRIEPDLQPVGFATDEEEVWPLLKRTRPDVVVLDVHHPGRDGLALCLQIKRDIHAPRLILYSASTDDLLLVAAALAGADAVVDKSAPTRALLEAIRGTDDRPPLAARITPTVQAEAAATLDPADRPILAMRLAATTPADIAQTLGLTLNELSGRVATIIRTALRYRHQPLPAFEGH
jgi:DNA-binding NarL/FixJ family response regulator